MKAPLSLLDPGRWEKRWSGLGSIGTVVLGALIYSERITPPKLISFVSIIYGAILFELAAGA